LFKIIFLTTFLPVAALAQGTRHDMGVQLNNLRVEVTVSSGLFVESGDGAISLRTYVEDKPSARRNDVSLPLALHTVTRRGNSRVLTYKVSPNVGDEAREFWDRQGGPRGIMSTFPFCLTQTPARRENITFRTSLPGIGYLPINRMQPTDLREMMMELAPCPPTERTD